MPAVNIHYAKTHLSRLVEEAAAGKDIVIAKAGKPMVRLVAIAAKRTRRKFGRFKGQFKMADDFDAPLPDALLREWGFAK